MVGRRQVDATPIYLGLPWSEEPNGGRTDALAPARATLGDV